MLILKTNPFGLDAEIEKLQTKLHTDLLAIWGIQSSSYKCYGRAYRNKTEDGYIAECYTGSGNYKEVYYDDTLSAISFFGISDKITIEDAAKVNVHMVYFVNLKKVKPNATDRPDDEVRNDVLYSLGAGLTSINVTSVELTVENALKEYPGSMRENRLKYVDMHPAHCFRINLELSYVPENNNCQPFSNIQ